MKKTYINPKTKSIELTENISLLEGSDEKLFSIEPNDNIEEYGVEQWVKRYKGVFGDEEW